MMKKKTKSAFPPKKLLEEMREKLSDPNYPYPNYALPNDADEVDRAKYQLCQMIARYRHEHGLLQKEIGAMIGVDESRISEILRGKIESFTLDRLVEYATKLHPSLKIEIRAA